MTPRSFTLLFALALAAGVAALYAFGINNQLIFDDARLTDGSIFGQYGGLLPLKLRLLSYGSFVWLTGILGDGWWKQRAFNIGLHIASALALYGFVLQLLQQTQWDRSQSDAARSPLSLRAAGAFGVALWAFNPVAVYAVAYLIQRSILMATLLVVMACSSYLRGLVSGQWRWHGLALVCYVLAVAAKEHAVSAILLAVPLFVFVRRPNPKQVMLVGLVSGLVFAAMGVVMLNRFGSIVGTVFDETSRAFATQLEQQRPGIAQQLYPLSIINQASLFFHYGFLWFLPYGTWMSIDVRPTFPLTLWSWHLLGALAWLGALVSGAWLVIRRNDVLGLIGLCLLLPCLLFVTEFATVWLQDPFVLYRGYLWSIAMPVLFALPLVGTSHKWPYALGLMLLALFAALSFERINSLQTPSTAWADAAAKIDRQAPANAVGRWRPVLNLASEFQEQGNYEEALRLFSQAEDLGEPMGSARFSMGVSLQQLKKYPQALDNFALAEAKGFKEAALYYQRGESQYALGRYKEAQESFTQALQHPQAAQAEQFTRQRQAEAAVASQDFDAAIASYRTLIQLNPDKQRYPLGLSMAYVRKKDYDTAITILNPEIARRPSAQAYFARALTYYYLGNRAASTQDLEMAMRADPNNPMYGNLQRQLNAPAAQPSAKPATKP